ncbi:MAG: MFS transporter [Terrisporobacter sp.]
MNLIKNRVFMTILATDIIQQGAIWIRNIAIMFFVMKISNSNPITISLLNLIEYLPMFLLTFIGGIIADKYNPKRLMLIGDFFSFVSFVILGFFVKDGVIIAIFMATLVSAIVTQFSYPASQKYFKEYVQEDMIEEAIGISQLLSSGFAIIGPFLGSYFYFNFGMDKTIFIVASLFLVSILLILTLPNKKFDVLPSGGLIEDTKLTFEYLKSKPQLIVFTKVLFVISFSLGIANNLDIFLVTQRLGLKEEFYQFFSGIAGVGMIVGGLIYMVIAKKLKDARILYILMSVFAFTVFFEGYSTIPALTIALQFVDNIIGGILSGYVMAVITKITDQEYLGKVNGLTSTLMLLGIMVGTVMSGIIMNAWSIVAAFIVASVGFVLATIILYKPSKKGIMDNL